MKQILLPACCLFAMTAFGQFRTPVKSTAQPIRTAPTAVKPMLVNTVAAGPNFTNPSTAFTLPDGKRMTVTLRSNMTNVPQNFGGSIRENVVSSNRTSENGFNCVSETRMLSATSSTFMNVNYDQQSIHIYPGAIYRFTDFFAGNFRPMEQSRNPITIYTDNLANSTGPVSQVVSVPSAPTINDQIANIIRPFSQSTGSAGLQYRIYNSENDADLAIKLGAGGGYAGFKASAGVNTGTTDKRYYLTIDVIKPLYTITTSVPSQGYFSDKTIEANNPNLMVLKSVTYGTRILANVSITINTQKDDIDFKASFGADSGKGVSANFNAMFNYVRNSSSRNQEVNAYVVGGPLKTTTFNTSKLEEEISALLAQCNYQSAKPIAYSFTDINGNSLGIESATDRFTTRKCSPPGAVYKLTSASISIRTGTDNKEQGSNASFTIYNSAGVPVFASDLNNTEFKVTNDITLTARNGVDPYLTEAAFANGGSMDIFFEPKQILFGWDAWNVEGVTLNIVLQDQNGASKPYQLNFNGAKALLQKGQQRLRLQFNGQFQPGSIQMPGL